MKYLLRFGVPVLAIVAVFNFMSVGNYLLAGLASIIGGALFLRYSIPVGVAVVFLLFAVIVIPMDLVKFMWNATKKTIQTLILILLS